MTTQQAFALAIQHHQTGRLKEAEALYRQILSIEPSHADAWHRYGVIAHHMGRHDLAAQWIRQALMLNPNDAGAHCNLGEVHRATGRLDEAIVSYSRALQLDPKHPMILNNLGLALDAKGELERAVAVYREALQIKSDYSEAYNNLGNALCGLGRFDEAASVYRRALQLQPNYSGAKFNYAILLLLRGDFERGWPLFEARWDANGSPKRDFCAPQWDGSMLKGQRVLIHAEQGFGDSIQFIRYAPLVAKRGRRVIVECQPGLKTLFANLEGVSQVLEIGEPWPAFDLHCPMMSLPLAFDTRVQTIPSPIPYLRADPTKVTRWRERLDLTIGVAGEPAPASGRPWKVGLIWAGDARPLQINANQIDQRRSVRLSQFGPLARVPGVVFVSLQKGEPAAQAQTPPEGMTLLDWTNELLDFADTAALIEALDLVISVDTAGAHLAGALGKPVWVLSRFDGCWRWLQDREDSPWYPTMRLFRQPTSGDWDSVMEQVEKALNRMALERKASPEL